jgi:hypothetical protein
MIAIGGWPARRLNESEPVAARPQAGIKVERRAHQRHEYGNINDLDCSQRRIWFSGSSDNRARG